MTTKSIGKVFFRGLVTLLPITLTIYILYSAVDILDGILGAVLRQILPVYIPGLGFVAAIGLIFVFGLMLNNLVIGRFMFLAEQKILEIPLIRAVYSPLKDLMNLFSKKATNLQQVVLAPMGAEGQLQLGLITREQFEELQLGDPIKDKVAVYFPFSYAIGGYTLLVPKKHLIPVNMSIEKAMSLAITGWIKAEKNDDKLN